MAIDFGRAGLPTLFAEDRSAFYVRNKQEQIGLVGPSIVTVETPFHVIPLFSRPGSSLPLGDLTARWARARRDVATGPDLRALSETVE